MYSYSVRERYGLVWLCVGHPERDILPFPEFDDERFRTVLCGPYGVDTSAPRIVENFLDMAHLPYVHAGMLGQEPYTEVQDYNVAEGVNGEGPVATNCLLWQPRPTLVDHDSNYVNYTYRVLRPFSAMLTKVPDTPGGHGVSILLTIQPVEPERSIAWILYGITDFTKAELEQRARQELIFFQDKPILENQVPKRLPLGPKVEMPVRCDRMSVAYRRYLKELDVRFGVTPAS